MLSALNYCQKYLSTKIKCNFIKVVVPWGTLQQHVLKTSAVQLVQMINCIQNKSFFT